MNYLKKPTLNDFKEFLKIYEKRPFKNNNGGLKIAHAFSLYFFLKNFKPTTVIESGVHKGGELTLLEQRVLMPILFASSLI